MSRRKSSRQVRKQQPAVGVCRKIRRCENQTASSFCFFLYSQSLLCRVQEKKNPWTTAAPTQLYCHEQFHWVQVSHLSHLTLYTRLDPLFQLEWRKQQQRSHLCALVLGCAPFWGSVWLCKAKTKAGTHRASDQVEANDQGEAALTAASEDCLRLAFLWDWRNFRRRFSALIIKEDSVSEFSHQAISLWLGLRASSSSPRGIICKHQRAAKAHRWAHGQTNTTANRHLQPPPWTPTWREAIRCPFMLLWGYTHMQLQNKNVSTFRRKEDITAFDDVTVEMNILCAFVVLQYRLRWVIFLDTA